MNESDLLATSSVCATPLYQDIKFRALETVYEYFNDQAIAVDKVSPERLRQVISRSVAVALTDSGRGFNAVEREQLKEDVYYEIHGHGPLEVFLRDPSVDDIIVNGPQKIYVEREGVLTRVPARFRDDAHLMNIIQRIVGPLGRRVDETMPFVDARLPDGSRVNVVIPPVAIDGPTVSIRKFRRTPLGSHDLIGLETLSKSMVDYLASAVRARLNILISGGTGSGKSTLLNVLSGFIPASERLVTIEDAAELQLRQPHVVRLETRMPNADGTREITARSILRNTLRMRPDRIIIGEVRGEEAVEMLQAMTTGHDGSMTTIHANSARDALSRLELLFGFGNLTIDVSTVRRQIASAVNLVVHLQRMNGGRRKVIEIAEVAGLEEGVIVLNSIFKWDGENSSSFVQESGHSIFRQRLSKSARDLHALHQP